MRALITGTNGPLGYALNNFMTSEYNSDFTNSSILDLRDKRNVIDYMENWQGHRDAARARARFVYKAQEPSGEEKAAAAVGIAVRLSGMLLLSKLFNGKK